MSLAVYILMRTDLNMSRGKMIAQGGHAVTELMLFKEDEGLVKKWFNEQGQTKITLAVNSEEELNDIADYCMENDIPYADIVDEGRTELEGWVFTCLGIGPVKRNKMFRLTGHLDALR